MNYDYIVSGIFRSRPNRFVAEVEINGKLETVHVKNTGRCRELLVPGATVYLEDYSHCMGTRKLAYSLVAVDKPVSDGGTLLINMDSQAPNKVVFEALKDGSLRLEGMSELVTVKPEAVRGSSRLDFYVCDKDGREGYMEVKGVTLENNGVAAFPDAPTERGIKHLHELIKIKSSGLNAYALFVIQMEGMKLFIPNRATHPAFADALKEAYNKGVELMAVGCHVSKNSLSLGEKVAISLDQGDNT